MKVLTVIDAFRLGGAETLLANLANVAPSAGLDLEVVSLSPWSPDRSALAPTLERSGLSPRYLNVRRTLDPPGLLSIVREIRRSRPDVVHAHLEMAITLAAPASAIAGVPLVSTFHSPHRPLKGRAAGRERLAVKAASWGFATIFVSETSRGSFVDRYRRSASIPRGWQVLHNGVDLDTFSPRSAVTPVGWSDWGLTGHPVVMSLAALREFKGITHLVAAWPHILGRHPDARLLIVGVGDQESALRSQVTRLALDQTVVFAGMRTDVADLMRASEVVVLPSTDGENLPTVLMEAGGCGRPVVASRIAGIPDIVEDGVTGLLTMPGSAAEVAGAVNRLLDSPDLRESLGNAARARMEERFDARLWARNLAAVYSQAVAAR